MNQSISQIKPTRPVMIKAHFQPQFSASGGMMKGTAIAPILEPELKIPVANALSFFGNHSAVALIAAGKFPDSVRPRKTLAIPKPNVPFAKAWQTAAILHKPVANA